MLAKLISSDIEINCSKPFSHTSSNSLDIEEEVAKQINTLKPFDMEPRMVIPQKHFVSEKQNKCEEEINLAPQNRIGNIDLCKCGYECKPMATFAETFCLFVRLNPEREHLTIQLLWATA